MYVADLPVAHEDGSFVSEKVSRIVELIRQYDSNLDVRWIKPAARMPGDAAFAIVEKTPDGYRTAFLINTEEEFDERVLARIYQGDARKHGDPRIRLDAIRRAESALKQKQFEESMEEANDQAKFFWKTPLHRVQLSKDRHINL